MNRTPMWDETVIEVAEHFVNTKSTVRKVAKDMHMSKTNVHLKLRQLIELPGVYYKEQELARKVQRLIDNNKSERYKRGGTKTQQILAEKRKNKKTHIV